MRPAKLIGGLEAVGEGLVEAGEKVAISIEGHLDRGMAEPFHDRLGVSALRDQHGRAGVPQVVESHGLGKSAWVETHADGIIATLLPGLC